MLFDDLVRGLFGDPARLFFMQVKLVINDLVRSRATDLVRRRVLRAYFSPNGYLVRTLRRGIPKLVFGCGGGLVCVLCDSCSAAEVVLFVSCAIPAPLRRRSCSCVVPICSGRCLFT